MFSLALSLHLFAESLSRLHGETGALLQPVEALERVGALVFHVFFLPDATHSPPHDLGLWDTAVTLNCSFACLRQEAQYSALMLARRLQSSGRAEAAVVVPGQWKVPTAVGHAAERSIVEPRAAASDPIRARCRALGICSADV